jgi:diadenosine tetraphosphate (Ap4A) HIT family hydrolase
MYCEENEKLQSNMIKIAELKYSIVYLNRNQVLPGRCIVAFKGHKTEYFQLNKEENAGYFAEVALSAQAIFNLYKPDKLNYMTFGDNVPHVHVHVVPKYRDRPYWGSGPGDEPKTLLTDEEYQGAIEKLRNELNRLSN